MIQYDIPACVIGHKSIQKKYSPMYKLFMRGPDENRAIIKLEEKEE